MNAARAQWPALAAFAWDRYLAQGRGALVVAASDLRTATSADAHLDPSYVPVDWVPKGDDYRPLMNQYEPEHEVLLIVTDEEGGDRLLRLRSDGARHPDPEQCWRRSPLASPEA